MVKGKLWINPVFNVQLEKVIDDVLKNGNIQALDSFLQRDMQDGIPIKCSQQFLTRLDKLVSGVRRSHLFICIDALLLVGFNKTMSLLFM